MSTQRKPEPVVTFHKNSEGVHIWNVPVPEENNPPTPAQDATDVKYRLCDG